MYYTLLPHQQIFKKSSIQHYFIYPSRLLLILPLVNKQVVLFYDNYQFFHVQLENMKILYQDKLEGKVFHGVAVNRFKLILMLVQKKNIIQVDLKDKNIKQIYKLRIDLFHFSKNDDRYFFLSNLHVFKQSQSYYVQQDRNEQRVIKFIFFPKITNMELQNQLFHFKEFPSKNYLYLKLDQKSKIVKFVQNPQQNGVFTFQQIDLVTDEAKKINVNNSSFVLYSTIIDIKRISQEKYIICVNGKNSQHEIILCDLIESKKLWTNKNIMKECLSINLDNKIGMFSFLYGSTIESQIIKVIDLQNGNLIDEVQIQADKIVVSLDHTYIVEYSRQKITSETRFKTLHLIGKMTNYLKMLENLGISHSYGSDFSNIVFNMLVTKQE